MPTDGFRVVAFIAFIACGASPLTAQSSTDGWGGVCWEAETGGGIRSVPAVTRDAVYVGSSDGFLYALDRRTGSIRWRFHAGSPVDGSSDVGASLVYVTARNGRLYAIEQGTGRLRWSHEAGPALAVGRGQGGYDVFVAGPRVAGSIVVAGGQDGVVAAFDALTGRVRWRVPLGASMWTTPAVSRGVVYAAANDGRLYALDLRTGRRQWQFETEGVGLDLAKEGFDRRSIQSSPVVSGDLVLFGSRDGHVYAVDVGSGQLRWRARNDPSWVVGSPTVVGDVVYVTTSDAQLVAALDVGTGRERWRRPVGARAFPAAAVLGNTIYVGTDSGHFVAIDRTTGDERWRYVVGDPIQSTAVIRDGTAYVGSDGGRVAAIALGAGSFPALAVFWDAAYTRLEPVAGGVALRAYLGDRGFQVLDTARLASFLRARIDDRRPSVVVFAQDIVPDVDTTLFRQYLAAAGKIVWFGNPPLAIGRDSTGGIQRDESGYPADLSFARTDRLLGLVYKSGFDPTSWPAWPTDAGRRWGLVSGSVMTGAVRVGAISEALALTETGAAGAWVKSYGGPSGSGFVMLGGGGIPKADGIPLDQLASIRRVAEYGLIRLAHDCR